MQRLSPLKIRRSTSISSQIRYKHNHVITKDERRYVSVFSKLRKETNIMDNNKNNNRVWHSPSFMSDCSVDQKEDWLERLLRQNESSSSTTTSVVDVEAFLVVLKDLALPESVHDAGGPRRADMWMNRLLELYHRKKDENENENKFHLDPKCYQYAIQAWANSDKETAIVIRNRSERWLNDIIQKSGDTLLSTVTIQQGKNNPPRPTTVLNNNNNNNNKPNNNKYDNDNDNDNDNDARTTKQIIAPSPKVKPTIHCFNAFIDGLTRGREGKNKRDRQILVENAAFSENILRRLHSMYCHRSKQQQQQQHQHQQQDKINTCSDDDVAVIRPNTDTFNYVIRGWTRCKQEHNIHKKVLAILRLMESNQRENPDSFITDSDLPRPNTKSYAMAMDALITVAKQKARGYYNDQKSRRNQHNYHDNGNGNDHRYREYEHEHEHDLNGMDEIKEATAILKYMHDLYDAGVEGVVPHRVPYNILITGYSALASFGQHKYEYNISDDNCGEQFKAEEILRTMMSHRDNGFMEASPDVLSYEKVMLAWANSGHPQSGARATWWLKQLWKDYELYPESASTSSHKSSLLPTVSTYNIVMKALAGTDGALAAENVLLDLGEKYRDERTDHPGLCPNSESFSIVIRAWLESADQARHVDQRIASIRRAYEWLSSLRGIENENNLSTAPQLFTGMLSLLKSCAKKRPNVLDLAQQIFEDYRQSRHRLDNFSYATLLQVGLLSYSETDNCEVRENFVENIFADCCNDGLVSNVFIRTLVDHPSNECKNLTHRVLLQDWPLPPSWSRNVKNKNNLPVPNDVKSSSERLALKRGRGNNRK
jgi:hypothetical protein